MRQWEPHGAELVVSGSLGIDDPARDIQVGLGIPVVKQPAVRIDVPYGRRAPRRQEQQAQSRETVTMPF
ncbi:MAG: hypothetical protein C5B51_18950 [Terriglobia bacterium]|nr:MAG: hypothetical protein C5B51_18950 [Terriglobia bacterium]